MKLRAKIGLLPLSAGLVFALGLLVTLMITLSTSGQLKQLRDEDAPYSILMLALDRNVEQFRQALQAAVSEGDASKVAEADAAAGKAAKTLDEMDKLLGKQPLAKDLRQNFSAYSQAALQLTRNMLDKKTGGPTVQDMQARQKALDALLERELAASRGAVDQAQEAVAQGVHRSLWASAATGLVVLLVLATASVVIMRSVWRDLGEEPADLRQQMRAIAGGNLALAPVPAGTHPDSLRASLGAMCTELNGTVAMIRHAADSIATATQQIAAGNQDLSDRTEHTASCLQASTSSMEDLTDSANHSRDAASQAGDLAGQAQKAAERGGEIVGQVVGNMAQIQDASTKVGEIISVIEGIAFQTNILALNAAVEAARAGEQGRGFAVVASEVRTLAQRSSSAAKEIKSLIVSSAEQVGVGVRLVNEAGGSMQDIVQGTQRVAQTIADLGRVSGEQASGIERANRSIAEVDQMTQQNAALVEQSSAAAASLREQATTLARAVASFQT